MSSLLAAVVVMSGAGVAAEAELRAIEQRVFAAIQNRSIDVLEQVLADDFVHATLGGDDQTRAAFLKAIHEMPYRILEIGGEGLRVHLWQDTAVVTGKQRARVALDDGSVVTDVSAFVDVFSHSASGWRLRHAASVEVPPPAARVEVPPPPKP
jgi:ketosteroid isomerase-like protein